MKGLVTNMIGNVDLDLLEKTYQNACIGITAIKAVLNKPDSREMNTQLHRHLRDYQEIAAKSKKQIQQHGVRVKEQSPYIKAMMIGNVKWNTLRDSSDSGIADIVIRGSMTGVTKMTRLLHSKKNTDGVSAEIAKEFIRKEEEYIKIMKDFL